MARPPAVLAIDAGSSRLRASVVVLADGSVVASGAGASLSQNGELELDALWGDLAAVTRELDFGQADVRAIAVAAQLGLVLVDAYGDPVRPALTWSDKRASDEVERLAESLAVDAVRAIGRPLAPELALARLPWIRKHEPGVLERTRWVLSIKDALIHRLTGAVMTDETSASYTGLFDVRQRRWADELVRVAGIDPRMLAKPRPGIAPAGALTVEAGRALGLPSGLPVAVGGPDGTVGAIGAGAVRAGVTVDVAGTTDVLLHTTDRPVSDPAQRTVLNAYSIPGLWTIGGPTGLTGGVVEWTASLLGFQSAEDAHRALGDGARTDGDPPIFVPTLDGSRFPTWRAEGAGLIAGLRPEHGSADVFLAAQQGVAFTVGEGLEALRSLGAAIDEVIVVGGGAARSATLQLRSDAWGLPIAALENREATTIGAAILGAIAGGCCPDLESAVRAFVHPAERYEPRPDTATATAMARRRWNSTAAATCETTTTDS